MQLAEPLAVEDLSSEDLRQHDALDSESPDHPLWSVSVLAADNTRHVPIRYLNPGCFEDLYCLYTAEHDDHQRVSKSTLYKAWAERWKKFIRFRNIGQGKRCKLCAQIDEERLNATTVDEKQAVAQLKHEQIKKIKADREVSLTTNYMAEKDAINQTETGEGQVIKIIIDGMDQAKFKVPRNLASSAEFEKLWRPTLHVVGVICHGHLEGYFIMPSDLAKDANMNCTVLSRTLDIVAKTCLKPNMAMPQNLAVAADNTTRESKNQWFANFQGCLVSRGKFLTAQQQFLPSGHSHNELDQRFSTVATALSRAPTLEDPEEFAHWIREHVKPVRGRRLHVEVLDATYDFQHWFTKAFGFNVSGLASTHLEPNANHVWHFVARGALPQVCGGPADVEVQMEDWKSLGQHDNDCVLLVKEFLHSKALSQLPLLFQPESVSEALKESDLLVMPKNEIGETAIKEFRKTALHVAKAPWHLFKAQKYLELLCDENEPGRAGLVQPLEFIFGHELKVKTAYCDCELPEHLQVDNQVRVVQVVAKAKARAKSSASQTLKRPAAAAAGPAERAVGRRPAAQQVPGPDSEPGVPGPVDAENAELEPVVVEGPGLVEAPPVVIVPKLNGCSKCKWGKFGCGQCRGWADRHHRGYYYGPGNEILRV